MSVIPEEEIYRVELDVTDRKLGVTLAEEDLVINTMKEDGAVAAYNRIHPKAPIRVGDQFLIVNDERVYTAKDFGTVVNLRDVVAATLRMRKRIEVREHDLALGSTVRILGHGADTFGTVMEDDKSKRPYKVRLHDGQVHWYSAREIEHSQEPIVDKLLAKLGDEAWAVADGGVPEANGRYFTSGTDRGKTTYRNMHGFTIRHLAHVGWCLGMANELYYFSNSHGDEPRLTGWKSAPGKEPAPTLMQVNLSNQQGKIIPGMRIKVVDMVRYDGQSGFAKKWLPSMSKWEVELDDGREVHLKAVNLVLVDNARVTLPELSHRVAAYARPCPNGHTVRVTKAALVGHCDVCRCDIKKRDWFERCGKCQPEWWRCVPCSEAVSAKAAQAELLKAVEATSGPTPLTAATFLESGKQSVGADWLCCVANNSSQKGKVGGAGRQR